MPNSFFYLLLKLNLQQPMIDNILVLIWPSPHLDPVLALQADSFPALCKNSRGNPTPQGKKNTKVNASPKHFRLISVENRIKITIALPQNFNHSTAVIIMMVRTALCFDWSTCVLFLLIFPGFGRIRTRRTEMLQNTIIINDTIRIKVDIERL